MIFSNFIEFLQSKNYIFFLILKNPFENEIIPFLKMILDIETKEVIKYLKTTQILYAGFITYISNPLPLKHEKNICTFMKLFDLLPLNYIR